MAFLSVKVGIQTTLRSLILNLFLYFGEQKRKNNICSVINKKKIKNPHLKWLISAPVTGALDCQVNLLFTPNKLLIDSC